MPRALPALEREAVPDARPPVAARRSRPATARPEPQARRATGLKEGSSPTPTCREQVGLKARRCNPGNLRPPGVLPLVRVEQDHRRVKRLTGPMLGFESFWTARRTLAGVEAMAMLAKGQVRAVPRHDMPAQRAFVHEIFGVAV